MIVDIYTQFGWINFPFLCDKKAELDINIQLRFGSHRYAILQWIIVPAPVQAR